MSQEQASQEYSQLMNELGMYKEKLDLKLQYEGPKIQKKAAKFEEMKKMSDFISAYVKKVSDMYGGIKDGMSDPLRVLSMINMIDELGGELKGYEQIFMKNRSFWDKLTRSKGQYGNLYALLKPANKVIDQYLAENMEDFMGYFSQLNKSATEAVKKRLPKIVEYKKEKFNDSKRKLEAYAAVK